MEVCKHEGTALTTVYSVDDFERCGKGYYYQCIDCWKIFPLAKTEEEARKIAKEEVKKDG